MAKVIYKKLTKEEAIRIYGKGMSFVGGSIHKDLQNLGQGNKDKQSNDNKNSITKEG